MKTLIAANWKMHGDMSWDEKPQEFRTFYAKNRKNVECLICPPTFLLPSLIKKSAKLDVLVGAQNCHPEVSGAFTGEISAHMIAALGASHIIVGHSERRAMFGETNEVVAAKAKAALEAELKPIICIGESESERRAGKELEVATDQLAMSIPNEALDVDFVIAYEPVWAIGTGLTPTIEDIKAMHNHIRSLLEVRFGRQQGENIQILYGGSVKPTNAEDILAIENVNGALIGGASLDMESFAQIADCA